MKSFILVLFLVPISIFAQKTKFDEAWKFYENGKSIEALNKLKKLDKTFIDKFSKRNQISTFTNISKIYQADKKYPEALFNLLLAKKINVNDSISYQGIYVVELGNVFAAIGAYNIAIEYIKKGLELTNDNYSKFLHTNRIGALYYTLHENDSALLYFKNQQKVSKKLGGNLYSSSHNNIGLVLMRKKQTKEALAYFLFAKSKMECGKDKEFENAVHGNLGRCYLDLLDYKKATNYLKIYHSNQNKAFLESSYLECLLVKCYLKQNQLFEAKIIEKEIKPYFSEMKTLAKIDLLKIQYAILIHEKKFVEADNIIQKLEEFRKIYDRETILNSNYANNIVANFMISESKLKLLLEKKAKINTQKELELEKKESNFVLFVSGSICIIITVFSGLFYQFNKNKRKKVILEKERLVLEEEKLKLKISNQESNLTDFAIDFNRKKEQNKETIKDLNLLMTVDDLNLRKEIKNLITQLKNQTIIDKNVEELNTKSELLLLNFKNILSAKHDNLTKAEIELCCMIKLNLSNKEIATFRNISDDSVKSLKTRLKKKLEISVETNLNDYIGQIS